MVPELGTKKRVASCPVAGQVHVQGRHATLKLELPMSEDVKVTLSRSTMDSVMQKIQEGKLTVPPTRQPSTKQAISNAMNHVQTSLRLRGGAQGEWNEETQACWPSKTSPQTMTRPHRILLRHLLLIQIRRLKVRCRKSPMQAENSSQPLDVDSLARTLDATQAALKAKTRDFAALHSCQADLATAEETIQRKKAEIINSQKEIEELRGKQADDQEVRGKQADDESEDDTESAGTAVDMTSD